MSTFYRKHKQLIDQSAHVAVGGLIVFTALVCGVADIYAFWGMLALAALREFDQHEWGPLGDGSYIDLAFFGVGGILAMALWGSIAMAQPATVEPLLCGKAQAMVEALEKSDNPAELAGKFIQDREWHAYVAPALAYLKWGGTSDRLARACSI